MSKIKKAVIIIVSVLLVLGVAFIVYYNVTDVDFGDIVIDGIPEKAEESKRIMSFNVRCMDDKNQLIRNRSKLVCAVIEQYSPDSFGVQEATPKWIKILDKNLGEKYGRVGEARDEKGRYTEYSCVYYLKDKYELLDSGTIWLSETPDVKYSESFNTACKRIASWAVLEDKETGLKYTHINTHLDHKLESTRYSQVKVLLNKIDELEKKGTVVCTGDFNAPRYEKTYPEMLGRMDDTSVTAAKADKGITFHEYGTIDENDREYELDYIFVTKNVPVNNYKIIRNSAEGIYPSDHYAICSDICIK